ncbi:MAG: Uncharacterised protein [Cyanobium sp. ARS6]|nr:MAG: Uncharacterised protein [Cyanobium sp. ARS6]
MGRSNRADAQFLQTLNQQVHLAGHRCHQAVVEMATLFFGAASVGFRPGVGAEVSAEELVAHQQPEALFESHQSAWPTGSWCGYQQQAAPVAQFECLLPADHSQRGKIWQRLCLIFNT